MPEGNKQPSGFILFISLTEIACKARSKSMIIINKVLSGNF